MDTSVANTPAAWDERARTAEPWTAACWSERGQTARFLAVLRHLDLRDGDTLLDYGCGPGRLASFLPLTVGYYGLDWSPAMRARAAAEPRATVYETLPDRLFDHVVCVGPFNLADQWSYAQTREALELLWAKHTRRTLAVSLHRGRVAGQLRYAPAEIAQLPSLLGCRRFVLDTSYLDNDLLLVMRR